MTTEIASSAPVSRFTFPYPTENSAQLRKAIVFLMLDGQRRSIAEMQEALGTRKELGARVRELRAGIFGVRWPFNDARSDGPDADGAFRYQLDITKLSDAQRRHE